VDALKKCATINHHHFNLSSFTTIVQAPEHFLICIWWSTWKSYKEVAMLTLYQLPHKCRAIHRFVRMSPLLFFVVILLSTDVQSNLYRDCGKLYNPLNYMSQLPSLSMPYVNIPIKPSPVITTKVINVVTKYVYKNPVCVRVSGKKSTCKSLHPQAGGVEHLVTKELFVKDRRRKQQGSVNELGDGLDMYVQGSEVPRPFTKQGKTPALSSEEVKDMLIEDRLDQLESILPQYTRRRVYQTTTITVTKVKSNNRATATLLVKNCVPQGYDLCPPKIKRRKSKIAKLSNGTIEQNYFG
jgi:hypothetical protein